MVKLDDSEFALLAPLILDATGIALDSSKAYLVESRLAPLLAKSGASSFAELYRRLAEDRGGELRRALVDRITTQETSFFRDEAPFDLLENKILPDLVDARSAMLPKGARVPLRIWSAACATGQEVYSIAIALKEALGDLSRYDIRLLGTDISDAAVAKASLGRYTAAELSRGMSAQRAEACFMREDGAFRVRDELRSLASFKRRDLREGFAPLGKWDLILCRNVAIYFADEAKRDLFGRVEQALAPGGCLVIGSTESLVGVCPQFEARRYLRSVYYVPRRDAGRAI